MKSNSPPTIRLASGPGVAFGVGVRVTDLAGVGDGVDDGTGVAVGVAVGLATGFDPHHRKALAFVAAIATSRIAAINE